MHACSIDWEPYRDSFVDGTGWVELEMLSRQGRKEFWTGEMSEQPLGKYAGAVGHRDFGIAYRITVDEKIGPTWLLFHPNPSASLQVSSFASCCGPNNH